MTLYHMHISYWSRKYKSRLLSWSL